MTFKWIAIGLASLGAALMIIASAVQRNEAAHQRMVNTAAHTAQSVPLAPGSVGKSMQRYRPH